MPEWTLYGQKLDLEEFKKNHPGGDLAILLGEERDCTRLFEQYHCRNASNQTVLKQLAAQQGKEIDPTIKDPFQQEVSQMAYDHKGGYTVSRSKIIMLFIFGAILITCWIGWAKGSWVACLLLPFINWVFGVNITHDGAHFAFSDIPWLNDFLTIFSCPLGYNATVWYLEHNVSHHTRTNEVGHDIDMHLSEPLVRSHKSAPWSFLNAFQDITCAILNFTFAVITQTIIFPLRLLFKCEKEKHFFGNYDALLKRSIPKIIIQYVIIAIFITLPFIFFKWPKAIAFVLIPSVLTSIILMTITQVSHIQEEVQPEKPNESWMRQMVETSMDYSQDSLFWTFATGGLNIQSLHHCIPAVESSHYIELYPKFRAICEKHGVKIHEVPTLWDGIKKYWLHIRNLTKEPVI